MSNLEQGMANVELKRAKAPSWGSALRHSTFGILCSTFLLFAGCTPEQRADCVVCNVTGLCTLLGDDPNAAMRKHPAWFGLKAAPAGGNTLASRSGPDGARTNTKGR